jgi:hypothetical protein
VAVASSTGRAVDLAWGDGVPRHLVLSFNALARFAEATGRAPLDAIRSLVVIKPSFASVDPHLLRAFVWCGLSMPVPKQPDRYEWAALTIDQVGDLIESWCLHDEHYEANLWLLADRVFESCYGAGLLRKRAEEAAPDADPPNAAVVPTAAV